LDNRRFNGIIMNKTLLLFVSLFLCAVFSGLCAAADRPDRAVAITIDDLPSAAATQMSAAAITEMTTKLLTTIRDQKVPVVGFVNERKLYKLGEVDERIKALQMWLDYGCELGNHTFSHASLNKIPLQAWEEEVVRGETVTSILLAQHKMKLRYFRHPYLDTGRDLETRRQAEAFLAQRGYRIAPITLDAWDWMYAPVYDDAKKRGDTALQKKLVDSYLQYSEQVFAYDEQLSMRILGYEPAQILLIHANQLEADHIGELFDLFRKRGYRLVTLQEALSDSAYSLPDTYVGEEGTGWLDHWAITMGKIPHGAPEFPQWVIDLAKPLHQSQEAY
jgi:peptidoglycan/xylan/chitin deacetylase (PgdA/CDA1 family)